MFSILSRLHTAGVSILRSSSARFASIPATMRAIDIFEFGKPEVLEVCEMPVPSPGEGEVLIKVQAAGVNRPDCVQRAGFYPAPPGASPIPGLEVSGTIASVGDGVTAWKVGDKVASLLSGGGYAEYAVANESLCLPKPENMGWELSAAIPETFFTVWYNVFLRCGFQPGQSFLVHGGTSGIGSTAIQLVRAFGGIPYATAGSSEKVFHCMELGAELAFNYKEVDWEEGIKSVGGVDMILDMVGGSYVQKNIDILKQDGKLINIAFLESPKTKINMMRMMLKRLTLTGTTLRSQSVAEKTAVAVDLLEKVWPKLGKPISDGGRALEPLLDQVFPLEDAWKSHEMLESGKAIGSIVLAVGDEAQPRVTREEYK